MITYEDIRAMIDGGNREQYWSIRDGLRSSVQTLESLYHATIEKSPADTIKKWVDAVGYEAAVDAMASLINRHGWDRRISRQACAWAATIENALDEEAAGKAGVYTNMIHLAHLDQLAAALMEFRPEPAPDQQDEAPAADDAAEQAEPEATPAGPTFTAHEMRTPDGTVYPVTYHIYAGQVIAEAVLDSDGGRATITIDEGTAWYIPAMCAAQEAERIAQAEAAAEKERRRAERRAARAADPDKQAHGPVPVKDWIGTKIQGLGYVIEFSRTYDRTMIRFDSTPTEAARAVVKEAGFYWAPSLGAWVKGLNWKAYRAALKVQEQFTTAKEAPCKPKGHRAA